MSNSGWIGVDLDGTLAHYPPPKGVDIGEPIFPMLDRVRKWVGKGQKVKIMTARASVPEMIPPLRAWLDSLNLEMVEITNAKDFSMIELWDDRAIQVIPNTGRRADGSA